MNATSSSSEWKCVICPETTCSTRPSQTNGAPGGWARICTTNARLVGSGSGGWDIGDLLQRPVQTGHVHVVRGMPEREHSGVLTGDVLTPSAFSTTYFHMYSHIRARLELSSVERIHCLHPSDRMFARWTPGLPTDKHLAPACYATFAACGLFCAVQKLLHMVRLLSKAKLYDI
jgi:hypothetical protein